MYEIAKVLGFAVMGGFILYLIYKNTIGKKK